MNSNEDYLDELLRSIEPITNPEGEKMPDEENSIDGEEETAAGYSDMENATDVSESLTQTDQEENNDIDEITPQISEENEAVIDISEQNPAQSEVADNESSREEIPEDISSAEADSNEFESMSEEEIEALINEAKMVTPIQTEQNDSADIRDLLEQYSGDENIDDIQNLLEKEENREAVDEGILIPQDMSDSQNTEEEAPESTDTQEDKAEKKRKKFSFRKNKKKEEQSDSEDFQPGDLPPEGDKKEKKDNIFIRVLKMLTEEDESLEEQTAVPEAGETGISDENLAILNELSKEDKKKQKREKKKGRKGKNEEAVSGEGGETSEAESKGNKEKKEKKSKKEKKLKKEKVQEPQKPEKKLPKKKVIAAFALCLTIMAVIIIMSTVFHDLHSKTEARWAFDNQDFSTCYQNLYGKKLSEAESVIYEKSELILSMNRKLSSYENFKKLGMNMEALNALFEGVSLHEKIADRASELGISDRIEAAYQTLHEKFQEYGLSDEDINEILAYESKVTYTKRLDSIVNGTPFEEEQPVEESKEAVPLEDVLPQEEDFLPENNVIDDGNVNVPQTEQSQETTQASENEGEVRVGSQNSTQNANTQGTRVTDGNMNLEAPVKDGAAVIER